jgi:hypothetical protein
MRNSNILLRAYQFLSALLLITWLAQANDTPWKSKPYAEWNEKDLQRIFTDSPWSRMTTITRSWLPLSRKESTERQLSGRDRAVPSQINQADEASVGGELNVYVYWASSRVMRAASMRKVVLHGDNTNMDVDKYASEPQDEYQIMIQSTDMAPFVRKDEKFFQANSFLEIKTTKQKISPSQVRYELGKDGVLVTAAIFFFPKKTASGQPTIPLDEKNVEFTCKIEGSILRVGFDPQKMVDRNGPAL